MVEKLMDLESRLDKSIDMLNDLLNEEIHAVFLNLNDNNILVNNDSKKLIHFFIKKSDSNNIKAKLEDYLGIEVTNLKKMRGSEFYWVYEFDFDIDNLFKLNDRFCYISINSVENNGDIFSLLS